MDRPKGLIHSIDMAWPLIEKIPTPWSIRKDPDGYRVTVQLREYECATFFEKSVGVAITKALAKLKEKNDSAL